MPRTKKVNNKRPRNNEDEVAKALKEEVLRIHEEGISEMKLVWQGRKEEINDIFRKFRCGISDEEMEMTLAQWLKLKTAAPEPLPDEINRSVAGKFDDDGYVTESSNRSSRAAKSKIRETKGKRRSKSAGGKINSSVMSACSLSRMNSFSGRASRSKYRTPANRMQTMSADRSVVTPVTPKITMNTPVSLLRYPRVGETVISMSGSPIIVNGGSTTGLANINIPIKEGIFSMQPNAITNVDAELVERIDSKTIRQLKQLQTNLAIVMNSIQGKKKLSD
ncbi:Borealin [Pseudolycoriella hygida]|uniref:Borealin n=1 Tax=Pseudolycoriella hygida TaxID=35572 RepID=A0A9Q0MPY4_9DIPT|nr:Borealin [Pseudolycoriella hygida]